MRIILRIVAVVVIFLTGYFYIFGKSKAETKSPPIRQELVHEYARKQIPLARAAHAATYACHEVTSDCDFSRDLRNVAEPAPTHYHLVAELGEERDLKTVAQVLGDRIPEVEGFTVKKLWSLPTPT